MSQADPQYWFRAKRYGWGWGLPLTWQGWLAYLIFFALLLSATPFFIPGRPIAFLIVVLFLSFLLIAFCYIKGEPPRWRWGEKD